MSRTEREKLQGEQDKKRTARAKKLAQIIQKIAKRGDYFRQTKTETVNGAEVNTTTEGHRYIRPGLTVKASTTTSVRHGLGSDDYSYAIQEEYFEAKEGRKILFRVTRQVKSNPTGEFLPLTAPLSHELWFVLDYKFEQIPPSWERRLNSLAAMPIPKRKVA